MAVPSPAGNRERHSLLRNPAGSDDEEIILTRARPKINSGTLPSQGSDYGSIEQLPVLGRYRRRVSCQRFCCNRLPKGKGSVLVFVINILESIVFSGAASAVHQLVLGNEGDNHSLGFFIYIGLKYCAGRIFYPVAGLLADVHFGRYKLIHISLWLLWIAFVLFSLALSLHPTKVLPVALTKYVIPIVAFILVSLGTGGVEATIIPFGADQLSQGASSDELSSYFYWYYFGRQAGALGGTLLFFALLSPTYVPSARKSTLVENFNLQIANIVQPVVVVLAMTVAIILHVSLKSWYFRNKQRENPLKLVINVLYYVATVKRHAPQYRRAFRYGEPWKPRIELAKAEYDGIFAGEEVEDVKTFLRILLIIFSLAGFFATYSGVSCLLAAASLHKFLSAESTYEFSFLQAYTMLSYQIRSLTLSAEGIKNPTADMNYLTGNLLTIFNTVTILFFCPLLNHLILPCLPSTSMKKRIGLGSLLNAVAIAVAAILEFSTFNHDTMQRVLLLMIPVLLISVAEALVFITGKHGHIKL